MGIVARGGEKVDASPFWLLFSLLNLSGLIYLALWGRSNFSIQAIIVFVIFSVMFLVSVIASMFDLFFVKNTFSQAAMWWLTGGVIWYALGRLSTIGGTKNILSVTSPDQLDLLSTISADLPLFWGWFINNVVAPVNEEAFWGIGLPVGLMLIMDGVGRDYPIFKHPALQFFVIILVSAASFAVFHVNNVVLLFLISAMIFRVLVMVIYWGDKEFNLIPEIQVFPAFMLGAHMGNNIAKSGGVFHAVNMMSRSYWGWLVGLIFLGLIYVALDRVIEIPRYGSGIQPVKDVWSLFRGKN